MPEYIFAETADHYRETTQLFKEYAAWLNIDLCFQRFEEELRGVNQMYAKPSGAVILCSEGGEYIACVALRPIDAESAELKRMYVKEPFRKAGIGESLLKMAVAYAKNAGYKTIKLDTLDTMQPAISLYKKHGFTECAAYYHNPHPAAVYLEKNL